MKRWRYRILCGISLLLCVATIILWVRSYWRLDLAAWSGSQGSWTMAISSGRVMLSRNKITSPPSAPVRPPKFSASSHPEPIQFQLTKLTASTVHFEFLGIGVSMGTLNIPEFSASGHGILNQTMYRLILPFWLIVLMTLTPPGIWWFWRYRRLRRVPAGAVPCPRCGYDLRATPERCPECGEEQKRSKAESLGVTES